MRNVLAAIATWVLSGCVASEGAAIVLDEAASTSGIADAGGTTTSSGSTSGATESPGTDGSTGDGATAGAEPFSVVLEAESAELTAPFEVGVDPTASQQAYVVVPGIGARHPQATARFAVEVPITGRYKLWPRVLAADIASNSFTLEVDGVVHKENWTWSVGSQWQLAGDVELPLTAGAHEVVVRGREAGTQLDFLVVASAQSEPPPEP